MFDSNGEQLKKDDWVRVRLLAPLRDDHKEATYEGRVKAFGDDWVAFEVPDQQSFDVEDLMTGRRTGSFTMRLGTVPAPLVDRMVMRRKRLIDMHHFGEDGTKLMFEGNACPFCMFEVTRLTDDSVIAEEEPDIDDVFARLDALEPTP